jgi:predicted O-methyltransferase YrrM
MRLRTVARTILPSRVVNAYWRMRGPGEDAVPQRTLLTKRNDSYDVLEVTAFLASINSARYYERNMLHCTVASDDLTLLTQALGWRQIDGLVMEFGVASGRTTNHLAGVVPNETIFGFDWFKGLPETWRPGFEAGTFAQATPAVRGNVTLVPGLFEQTLPSFLAAHAGPVSLLHIDCDLYSSTVTILTNLASRIVPGTIIVFDEYFNYPGWRQHEFRAFQEFVTDNNRQYRYLGFVAHHQQACVVVTA